MTLKEILNMCDREVSKWEVVIALSHFLSAATNIFAFLLLSLEITSQMRESTAFSHHIC